MIKIFVADDHALVREGIRRTLASEPDLQVVGDASDGVELLSKIEVLPVDLLILDIMMPGKDGLEVLRLLRKRCSKLRILILSLYPEEIMATRAFKAGAAGYLTKESAPEELIKAIRKVASGRKYVSPLFAETLVNDLQKETTKPLHETLSDRELQVLCMIARGKTITEIAKELSLSVATVNTYRSRILEKMQMKTSAALVHYAIRNRLVE
ncbi:MAG: response regulator transcription factor [Ignavibacteriales bacterium]|nr:response regulator transcription factor [Ignavibacteriales bacterium]